MRNGTGSIVHRARRAVRRWAGIVLAVVVLPVVAAPGTAQAGVADMTCVPPGSSVATFTPPLTATAQPVATTLTVSYGPCVSPGAPAVTSGTVSQSGNPPGRSCLELLQPGPVSFTITWNTGQTSTVIGNRVSTIAGAVLETVVTGTVTAGLFTGDTVVQSSTGASVDVTLCTVGLGTVAALYAVVTLEITSL